MRFPDTPYMYRVFDLFRTRLNIGQKLIPYYLSDPNEILLYNGIRYLRHELPPNDPFHDNLPPFTNESPNHWIDKCTKPFIDLLVSDPEAGWEFLLKYDQYSARSFMATAFNDPPLVKEAYPSPVIDWLERMSTGTGMFDLGFSHMVLGGLTFNYPTAFALAYGCDVEDIGVLGWDWFCVA